MTGWSRRAPRPAVAALLVAVTLVGCARPRPTPPAHVPAAPAPAPARTTPAAPAQEGLPPVRARVPVVPPDTVPRDFWDRSHIIPRAPCSSFRLLNNAVGVLFKKTASQEERQAAVDAIDGEVVGGILRDEYYVRVAGDSTGESVCRAVRILQGLPQVDFALRLEFDTIKH